MVKLRKNKLKQLNKIKKQQEAGSITNKIVRKRINVEKKVTFQKQVLLKDAITKKSALVKNVSIPRKEAKKPALQETSNEPPTQQAVAKILKPIQKRKQRHKTLINDTKLLMKLMKSE